MKPISNKIWIVILVVLLAVSAVAAWFLTGRTVEQTPQEVGPIAVIQLDGEEVQRIDLGAVTEGYTFSLTGKSGITNTVEVQPGKIRVVESTCPDQICVYEGWLSESVLPIVCLPNTLVISLEQVESEVDGRA